MPETNDEGRPGIGVDSRGGGVIDPTKNVLDLVRAESKYQDAMREALAKHEDGMRDTIKEQQNLARAHDSKFQDYAREAEERLQNWMRDAESKRTDQLADLRQVYEKRIADMLAESVRSTSTLVSSQLVQIQATFNDRVSKLEEFRWSSAGKSSVSDPQMADAITRMTDGLTSLERKMTATFSVISGEEKEVTGQRKGMVDTNVRLIAVIMAIAAIASAMFSGILAFMFIRGH